MWLKLQILRFLLHYNYRRVPKERAALEKWQDRQIQRHLRRIAKRSPFYAKRLKKHGKWQQLPTIDKEQFMANFDSINTVGIQKEEAFDIALKAEESRDFSPTINGITVGLSSGTSGNRGIFLASTKERAQWVAYVLLYVLGWQWRKRKVAFFLRANSNLYSAAQSRLIDFRFFDLKADLDENIQALNHYQADILVAQPSMLKPIAQAQLQGRLNIRPQKIISVAEVLEPSDHSILKKAFKQVIHQAYQCTEGFLAKTCPYGTLHFNEDIVKIEKKYIDDRRYHPIITDFTRSTQPIIRYELNDIIIDKKEPCPCGSVFQAIDHIEGRSDDVFLLTDKHGKSIRIFPDFIRRAIVTATTQVRAYIVEQTKANQIVIYLDTLDFERCQASIETSIGQLLQSFEIDNINLVFKPTIPTLKGNKLRRIMRTYVPA